MDIPGDRRQEVVLGMQYLKVKVAHGQQRRGDPGQQVLEVVSGRKDETVSLGPPPHGPPGLPGRLGCPRRHLPPEDTGDKTEATIKEVIPGRHRHGRPALPEPIGDPHLQRHPALPRGPQQQEAGRDPRQSPQMTSPRRAGPPGDPRLGLHAGAAAQDGQEEDEIKDPMTGAVGHPPRGALLRAMLGGRGGHLHGVPLLPGHGGRNKGSRQTPRSRGATVSTPRVNPEPGVSSRPVPESRVRPPRVRPRLPPTPSTPRSVEDLVGPSRRSSVMTGPEATARG